MQHPRPPTNGGPRSCRLPRMDIITILIIVLIVIVVLAVFGHGRF